MLLLDFVGYQELKLFLVFSDFPQRPDVKTNGRILIMKQCESPIVKYQIQSNNAIYLCVSCQTFIISVWLSYGRSRCFSGCRTEKEYQ